MRWRKAQLDEKKVERYVELIEKINSGSYGDEEIDEFNDLEDYIKDELEPIALEIAQSAAKAAVSVVESNLHKAIPKDAKETFVQEVIDNLLTSIQNKATLEEAKKDADLDIEDAADDYVRQVLFGEE